MMRKSIFHGQNAIVQAANSGTSVKGGNSSTMRVMHEVGD